MASTSGGHGDTTSPRAAPGANPQNLRPGDYENSLTENLKSAKIKLKHFFRFFSDPIENDDLFVDFQSKIYILMSVGKGRALGAGQICSYNREFCRIFNVISSSKMATTFLAFQPPKSDDHT